MVVCCCRLIYSTSVLSFFYSCLFLFLFFFFKQKTAYEMRISDWSSDVCSSDLHADAAIEGPRHLVVRDAAGSHQPSKDRRKLPSPGFERRREPVRDRKSVV